MQLKLFFHSLLNQQYDDTSGNQYDHLTKLQCWKMHETFPDTSESRPSSFEPQFDK